eukprot:8981052-Pyramimonas_sp.AAC.1
MRPELCQLFLRKYSETQAVPFGHKRYEAYVSSVFELGYLGALRDQSDKAFAPALRREILPTGQALKEV